MQWQLLATHSGYCDIHSNHCYNPDMEAKLLHIPWMVTVLYSSIPLFWFAIHPFADFWRRMHRSPYWLLLPIWGAIIFALAWATWPWHSDASLFFAVDVGAGSASDVFWSQDIHRHTLWFWHAQVER